MCGRYQRRSDKQRIAEAFKLGNLSFWNSFPTTTPLPARCTRSLSGMQANVADDVLQIPSTLMSRSEEVQTQNHECEGRQVAGKWYVEGLLSPTMLPHPC
jgi:hypothetical protein